MTKIAKIRKMAYIALFTALLSVCSWISIPTSIPFTMQTTAVFLAAGLLGWRSGTLAVCAYLLLGTLGVPVFAGFRGGFGVLLGATGGYLIGFAPAAAISGAVMDRFGRRISVMFGAMALGNVVCYLVGTAWFVYAYTGTASVAGFYGAFSLCVLPYLLPDALKIVLAAWLTKKLYPRVMVERPARAA